MARVIILAVMAILGTTSPGCFYIAGGFALGTSGGGGSADVAGDGTNVAPAVVVTTPGRILDTESEREVEVTVIDGDGDAVALSATFQVGAGAASPMTLANAAELQAVSGTAAGAQVRLRWRVSDDLAPLTQVRDGVTISVRASDGALTSPTATSAPFMAGNAPPEVRDAALVGSVASGNIRITFTLVDSTSDPATVRLEYEWPTGGVTTFTAATTFDPGTQFPTSPTGVASSIFWNSAATADLGGRTARGVRLRLVAIDSTPGSPTPLGVTLTVDNNAAPRVVLDDAVVDPDVVGPIGISLRLIDDEGDRADVVLQWAEPGEAFSPADPLNPGFPDLDQFGDFADPAVREAVLADPAKRRALRILTEATTPLDGHVERPGPGLSPPLGANELLASQLLERPELLSGDRRTLVGKTLEVMGGPGLRTVAAFAGASPRAFTPVPDGDLDRDNDAALVGLSTGALVRVNLLSGASTPVASGLGDPVAIALSPHAGVPSEAIVTDGSGGRLLGVDLSSGAVRVIRDGLTAPLGVAVVSPRHGIVTEETPGRALLFELATGVSVTIAAGLRAPRGVAVARDRRKAWIAERDGDAVMEIDLLSYNRRAVPVAGGAPLTRASWLSLDAERGRLFVATDEGGASRVVLLNLATRQSGVVIPSVPAPAGVALAPDGGVLVSTGSTLAARGGVVQRRRIDSVTLSPPLLGVDADFAPPLAGGERWRIPGGLSSGVRDLATAAATGAPYTFHWDCAKDLVPQRPLRVAVTALDTKRGPAVLTGARTPLLLAKLGGGLELTAPGDLDQPRWIRAADVNGDGQKDLLVCAEFSSTIAVFKSLGLGRDFEPPQILRPSNGADFQAPYALVVQDLDGDGLVDIASANCLSDSVTTFFGGAGGAFGAEPSQVLKPGVARQRCPLLLQAADLDGDGLTDLVSTNVGTDTVTIFRQTSARVFGSSPQQVIGPFPEPHTPVLADWNADGHPDLIVSTTISGFIGLFRNNGAGIMVDPLLISVDPVALPSPGGLDAADFDGDGLLDLAVSSSFTNAVGIFRQTAPGQFEAAPSTLLLSPTSISHQIGNIAAADMNGDGLADLVVGSAQEAVIFLQRSPGVFDPEVAVVVAGDPNPTGQVSGSGIIGNGVTAFVVEDLDGDGRVDLAAAQKANQKATVFLQPGPGRLARRPVVELRPGESMLKAVRTPTLADLDGDGAPELVVASQDTDRVNVFARRAGAFFELIPQRLLGAHPAGALDAGDLAAFDLDGDGLLEVAAPSQNTHSLSIFRQGAPGVFDAARTQVISPGGSNLGDPSRLSVGDVDGDGRPDVAVLGVSTHSIWIFRQTASAGLDPTPMHVIGPGPGVMEQPNCLALDDVDGDGRLDVVAVGNPGFGNGDGNLCVFFQKPGGGFEALPEVNVTPGPTLRFAHDIVVGDFDGDGRRDIATANITSMNLTIFRQTAPRAFDTTPSFTLPGQFALDAADLDGDGLLEVASARRDNGANEVIRQTAPGRFEPHASLRAAQILPWHVRFADADRDGIPDLLATDDFAQDGITIFSTPRE